MTSEWVEPAALVGPLSCELLCFFNLQIWNRIDRSWDYLQSPVKGSEEEFTSWVERGRVKTEEGTEQSVKKGKVGGGGGATVSLLCLTDGIILMMPWGHNTTQQQVKTNAGGNKNDSCFRVLWQFHDVRGQIMPLQLYIICDRAGSLEIPSLFFLTF